MNKELFEAMWILQNSCETSNDAVAIFQKLVNDVAGESGKEMQYLADRSNAALGVLEAILKYLQEEYGEGYNEWYEENFS